MKTADVIYRYHGMVPFPWTPRKIKKAGYEPTRLLLDLGTELEKCDDAHSPTALELLNMLHELKLLGE